MLKIGVCGVGGRMGQLVAALVRDSEDLLLVACTEAPGHPLVGQDVGAACGRPPVGVPISADAQALAAAAVAIDFTRPAATLQAARVCAAAGVAMVVGTTGFTAAELAEFRRAVAPIACVFSPNYSTAMNLLFKLVREAAAVLGEQYDVEVIEAHHRHKVDAPSGTALRLAEAAAAGLQLDLARSAVYGRQGVTGERPRQQIGIHAIRAGDLVGDHTVLYGGPGECLELRHRATSREAFARGALRAARFAAQARPGLYSMADVLGTA